MADPASSAAPAGRLAGRIALVTGASRGIGAAVARRFAAKGAHLILCARTQGGLEELDDDIRGLGGTASLVPGDLTDEDTVERMALAVRDRYGHLDVLVGNAGMLGVLGPIGHMEPKLWRQVMELNVNVNWRLIRAFDPLLRASDAGRAVFVTSTVGHSPRAYWGAYAVSKAALESMVQVYAAEITKTKVRANLINPGKTRTRMRAEAYPGEDPMSLKTPDDLAEVFVELAEPACDRNGEVINVA